MLCGGVEKIVETSLVVHDFSIDLQVMLERRPTISEEPQDALCIPVTRPRSFLCIFDGAFFVGRRQICKCRITGKSREYKGKQIPARFFDTVIELRLAF
jgi:hypothetical protein